MATESTEEHGKIKNFQEIFSCSSVDSVAKIFLSLLRILHDYFNGSCCLELNRQLVFIVPGFFFFYQA